MNGVVRSSFKLTSSSTFMNIFRQTIKPENAKQRLFSTFWNAGMKSVENNLPKATVLYNKCDYRAKHSSNSKFTFVGIFATINFQILVLVLCDHINSYLFS